MILVWLAQAFRASNTIDFVVKTKHKYEESIKEGQEYLDSISK